MFIKSKTVATRKLKKNNGGLHMVNELKTICDLLEGYSPDRKYVVLAATKLTADGKWELTIQRVEEVKSQEEANADK